ncbi:hypothetical protein [Polymorphospora lycopeni]|uniref:Uncharacterized protein n=1 Tax=Polymorphospora lycopeni TaxID=3140240 RepID=A0ABV5CK25_9ACTN
MEMPAGAQLALQAVRRQVESAHPDAPVRPGPAPGRHRPRPLLAGARCRTARGLHRLADWIQPGAVAVRAGE